MSLRKRFLFAMLFTIVAFTADGKGNDTKAGLNALKPGTELRAPVPGPWLNSVPPNSALLPPSLLPIQFKDPKDLAVGKLLVASRGMGDPNFAQTVILLVHYDEKGVVGLVLNRRTDLPLSKVLDLEAAKDRSDPVYLGGPVGTSGVFALLQTSTKIEKAENIFGGVYLIADKGLFEETISARPDSSVFHVYLGYAGWTQEQLRAEVQLGAWLILPANAAAVFKSEPNSLWRQMIQDTELPWAKNEPFARSVQSVPLA